MLCFWDIPDSMPALVSSGVTSGGRDKVSRACYRCVCACQGAQHALVMQSVCEAVLASS